MPTKRKSKGAYMISAVAEMYEIHPQTLRLYEREGLLQPSRTVGNTRLYTDEDLERLEFILNLARDLGVNAGLRQLRTDGNADQNATRYASQRGGIGCPAPAGGGSPRTA
jgi:DNA-binding transcriptional MerR regulator